MGVSWGALSGSFLAPFLYGLYWKKTTKVSVIVSFIFGTLMMVVQLLISTKVIVTSNAFIGFVFKNSLYSGVFSMLASLILVPLVSVISQKSKPQNVESMFSCYDKTVMVPAKDVLIDEE